MGSIATNMVKTSAQQEFERLYNAYCGRIYSYAMMISKGDTYLSEEILQLHQVRQHLDCQLHLHR